MNILTILLPNSFCLPSGMINCITFLIKILCVQFESKICSIRHYIDYSIVETKLNFSPQTECFDVKFAKNTNWGEIQYFNRRRGLIRRHFYFPIISQLRPNFALSTRLNWDKTFFCRDSHVWCVTNSNETNVLWVVDLSNTKRQVLK